MSSCAHKLADGSAVKRYSSEMSGRNRSLHVNTEHNDQREPVREPENLVAILASSLRTASGPSWNVRTDLEETGAHADRLCS